MSTRMTRAQILALGAAAMIPATAASVASAASAAPAFHFDQARFDAILASPARHRQCFASTKLSDGLVLEKMVSSMYAYEITLSQGAGALHAVAVLYGGLSVALAFNDELWNEIVVPSYARIEPKYRVQFASQPVAGKGNPYLHRASSQPLVDDQAVEPLVSRGANFFVCNNALEGYAGLFARALDASSDAIYQRLVKGLVPGSMPVPAGVMAINACQEARFTYLQVTL